MCVFPKGSKKKIWIKSKMGGGFRFESTFSCIFFTFNVGGVGGGGGCSGVWLKTTFLHFFEPFPNTMIL